MNNSETDKGIATGGGYQLDGKTSFLKNSVGAVFFYRPVIGIQQLRQRHPEANQPIHEKVFDAILDKLSDIHSR